MKIALFYHSLISDWNHGNAHFLRGIATKLIERGHAVAVFEPEDGWSVQHLRADYGDAAIESFHTAYPKLRSDRYGLDLYLEEALDRVDLVPVHEWNSPELVRRIGEHRARHRSYALLFHDPIIALSPRGRRWPVTISRITTASLLTARCCGTSI